MTGLRILVPCCRRRVTFAAAVVSLLLAAGAARADWLVMADGTRVETRGEWAVKGKLVVFTGAAGALASLRLSEVDLEASRAATAAAAEEARRAREAAAKPDPPAARPGPVLVLTDADVGHVDAATQEEWRADAALGSQVVLYSATWCGFCKQTKALLAELEVPYREKDVEKTPGARAEYVARFGANVTIPVLDVGGSVVRGYRPHDIRRAVEGLKARLRPPEPGPGGDQRAAPHPPG
jgi:mycoredoxin